MSDSNKEKDEKELTESEMDAIDDQHFDSE